MIHVWKVDFPLSFGTDVFGTDVDDGGSGCYMVEPVAESTEEELNCFISCLVLKLLIRRCHIGVLNEKLAFCKRTTKALLKPHIEPIALLTLRVPPVLTVALLNFYLT